LNYTYGYYEQEIGEGGKTQYRLVIKAYFVAPLIKKILAPWTLAYSATIGDAETFGFESGIRFPFYAFESDFPAKNTKIFMPIDTPNLAVKSRNRQDLTRSLRKIVRVCRNFQDTGLRSLVVVVSNLEREKFLILTKEEGVDAISYGNGIKPREAARKFQQGEGSVLVGTVANYGEGIDLPKNLAPIIFFLRPAYPNPKDPATIFEERRFGNMRWRLWNWRVMVEALQVRGRNIRSARDLGVTIFISQQFRRFMPAVFPKWLEEAYRGDLRLEECVKVTKDLLGTA
jgi:Rad3-related DNA helicase